MPKLKRGNSGVLGTSKAARAAKAKRLKNAKQSGNSFSSLVHVSGSDNVQSTSNAPQVPLS